MSFLHGWYFAPATGSAAAGGSGITSIAIIGSPSSIISVSGSPITGEGGTITLTMPKASASASGYLSRQDWLMLASFSGAVIVHHTGSTKSVFFPTENTDNGRGSALLSAITSFFPNDKIEVGYGKYTVGLNNMDVLNRSIYGQGKDATEIVGGTLSDLSYVIAVQNGSISDLTIRQTGDSANNTLLYLNGQTRVNNIRAIHEFGENALYITSGVHILNDVEIEQGHLHFTDAAICTGYNVFCQRNIGSKSLFYLAEANLARFTLFDSNVKNMAANSGAIIFYPGSNNIIDIYGGHYESVSGQIIFNSILSKVKASNASLISHSAHAVLNNATNTYTAIENCIVSGNVGLNNMNGIMINRRSAVNNFSGIMTFDYGHIDNTATGNVSSNSKAGTIIYDDTTSEILVYNGTSWFPLGAFNNSLIYNVKKQNKITTYSPLDNTDIARGTAARNALETSNLSSGDAVYIGPGAYQFTDTIHVPIGVSVFGGGIFNTIIYSTGNTELFYCSGSNDIHNLSVRQLNPTGSAQEAILIQTSGIARFHNIGIYTQSPTTACVWLQNYATGLFYDCIFKNYIYTAATFDTLIELYNCQFVDDSIYCYAGATDEVTDRRGIINAYNCKFAGTGLNTSLIYISVDTGLNKKSEIKACTFNLIAGQYGMKGGGRLIIDNSLFNTVFNSTGIYANTPSPYGDWNITNCAFLGSGVPIKNDGGFGDANITIGNVVLTGIQGNISSILPGSIVPITNTGNISSPLPGSIIFNQTTSGFMGFNGVSWVTF